MLGRIAAFWGVLGVCTLLLLAIIRLSKYALALFDYPLSGLQFALLIFSVVFMAYSEGYKGFQLAFSPRVVSRAHHLLENPKPLWVILAPFFCMSYIGAPLKRKIISLLLTTMIICAVIFMRYLPQPWRGIVDAGVVVGLCWGLLSIIYFCFQAFAGKLVYEPEVA